MKRFFVQLHLQLQLQYSLLKAATNVHHAGNRCQLVVSNNNAQKFKKVFTFDFSVKVQVKS